ncbi:SigB/SigF/SigG family RNA polymerase sigma factor [Mycolicibacterium pulveris]|uniref:SigB/SigF/SigG family RNA polymerase sigma factor n=1 Tax=Mycolicibacterium pulveris TaxID=36813 RepID=UPI003CF7B79D
MTTATRRRTNSDYGEIPELIRTVRAMPPESVAYQRMHEQIVHRCLPLAEHIAHRYGGRGEPRDDLVQTARLGLLNAIDRFDPESGNDFLSFAVPTIMGEVKRYFRDSGWAVHVPRRLKEARATVTAATSRLSQRMGRAPTPTEVADELGMSREEVVEALIAAQCYQIGSLDAPARGDSDDGGPAIVDRLGANDTGIDIVEFRHALRPLMAALPPREREILTMRFFGSHTQTQIAQRLGISQMHVSRLLAKTLATLRDGLDA